MKRKEFSCAAACLAVLALLLLAGGLAAVLVVFRGYRASALYEALRFTAWQLVLGGAVAALGLGMLVILIWHLPGRAAWTRREMDALRRKTEAIEAIQQRTQQLAHHQRLETIGTLTSSIAHEFNNLLTPIMGYSLMALEKLPTDEEELYDNILEIYNASRKAKDIISRLSDLSRKNTSATFRQVSPDDLIRKTLDVANPARPPRVEVRLDLNCWEQRILANEIQLSQLLLNLILNGFHAMEIRGGTLTVTTSFDEEHIHICVADTGCGIPEEVLPRIFEPFFTTKEAGKGTGLGLAIAAQVVEDHRGSMRVESQVDKGTTFCVSLLRDFAPGAGE